MTKECYFSYNDTLNALLEDKLETASHKVSSTGYIVSNQPDNAEIFAPEINFYCKNSLASFPEQAETIIKMYNARLDAFDFSREILTNVPLGNKILIISNNEENLIIEQLKSINFEIVQIKTAHFCKLNGEIGSFQVESTEKNWDPTHLFDQIVWESVPENFRYFKGIHDLKQNQPEEIIQAIAAIPKQINISRKIHYQRATCLHNVKGTSTCNKCISVCPFGAIKHRDDGAGLQLIHSACTGCGLCVSQCPTGSLDSTSIPRDSFAQICSHYTNRSVLIIPETVDLEEFNIDLPAEVIPLVIKSDLILDENYLLNLLAATHKQVFLYSTSGNTLLSSNIDFVNQVYLRKFGRNGIVYCTSKEEIEKAFIDLHTTNYTTGSASLQESFLSKRAHTSFHLKNLVGNDNLGTINNHPAFGSLSLNTDNCTLCLACADVCPMGALTVHPEDNSLRYTASLCIQCGSCSLTCPEQNCLSLIPNSFSLEPASFAPQIVAQDELFTCLECGKEFAPKKAVQKVINTMSQHFSNDPVKLKTLSCCPDCKTKLMVEQQIFNQQGIGV